MKCACCGKSIRKFTRSVFVEKEPTSYHGKSSWARYSYFGDGPAPKTMADCRPLTNQVVVSMKRHFEEDRVASFNEWDGKTYLPCYGFFCTNHCAASYGKAAVELGWRVK